MKPVSAQVQISVQIFVYQFLCTRKYNISSSNQSEICRSEAVVAVEVVDAVAAVVAVEVVAVDSTETKIWAHQTLSYHLETWRTCVRNCFILA